MTSRTGTIFKLVDNVTKDSYYGATTNDPKRYLLDMEKKAKKGGHAYDKIINRGDYDLTIIETDVEFGPRSELDLQRNMIGVKDPKCVNFDLQSAKKNPIAYIQKTKRVLKMKSDISIQKAKPKNVEAKNNTFRNDAKFQKACDDGSIFDD